VNEHPPDPPNLESALSSSTLIREMPHAPRVLRALAAASAAHPYDRKLLVCRRPGIGRELLRTLAARGVSWIGWEITTAARLAADLSARDLAAERLAVTDEFDELALLDASIDQVLDGATGRLAELAEGPGLRQAVAASVRAMRQAGIRAAQLERTRFRDEDKRAQVARIMAEYERRLHAPFTTVDGAAMRGRRDRADVFDYAASAVAAGTRAPDGLVFIMPDHSRRGLPGGFLDALIERGAQVLDEDPVHGLARPDWWLDQRAASASADAAPHAGAARHADATPLSWLHDVAGWANATARARVPQQSSPARTSAPTKAGRADAAGTGTTDATGAVTTDAAGDVTLDVFAATSVSAELREVLRRVVASGLHWDEVEIVATDVEVYGVALDGIVRPLGVPVSHAAGLPVARTRPGRALAKYLEWVEQGFPADVLRQMIDRGDIAAPADTAGSASGAGGVYGTAIARRLRTLKVGRGRDRYTDALARAERALDAPQSPEDERSPEEFAEAREQSRRELAALASIVRPLLAATPDIGDALHVHDAVVAPGELARGLLALLELVPARTAVDRTALGRLRQPLRRMVHALTRRTTLRGAIAVVRSKLEDRVPAPEAAGASPWTSSGGRLHLSDLDHGGFAGRKATFIVGLDAGRFPGAVGTDALLVDDDRRRLTAGQRTPGLPTAAERIDERRYAFAALVARLRGRVTFSYATWDAVEGRATTPASELLQAYRLMSGDATADYEKLHEATAPAVSPVPRGSALLDSDDVWLAALAHNGALRRGVDVVCAAYPRLAAGVRGWKTRLRSDAATPYHGAILPRAALDPRNNALRVISPTQLQTLGTCPHRYLLRYVLRVKPPEDAQPSPEQWLPPLEKGSLMHAVYERSLRRAQDTAVPVTSDAFDAIVADMLDDEIERMRERLPPPGGAVFRQECEALRDDARAFIAMVREDVADRTLLEFERMFGRAGEPPVELTLPDGSVLRLNGAIDRIDALEDGRLVVVDYKTGSTFRYGGKSGAYDGGRRLQHVLYAKAAEQLLGARTAWSEYQFPTRRSENYRARYAVEELHDGLALVTELLDFVANGWFIPTNVTDDCKFCDYAAVCRANVDDYGKVDSPLAEWSREGAGDAVELLRRVRR
jgi:hypothetical protein